MLAVVFAISNMYDTKTYAYIAKCMARRLKGYWVVEIKSTIAYTISVLIGMLLTKHLEHVGIIQKYGTIGSMSIVMVITLSIVVYVVFRDFLGKAIAGR